MYLGKRPSRGVGQPTPTLTPSKSSLYVTLKLKFLRKADLVWQEFLQVLRALSGSLEFLLSLFV